MPEIDSKPNPYVGPRAFTTGENLYGRDRELRDLLDLLIAERIVLLYSPSGAGKSSLIQAGLIPGLLEENFHVLPVIRLNYEPPADLGQTEGFNRYSFSAIQSLEEELPEDEQSPAEIINEMTLVEYLAQRIIKEDDPDTEVLIFDQFEEVVTFDITDQDAKINFFHQLGTALRDRKRWALFSIREDFVGALTPYLRPIPTRLSNTFRLELLGKESARQAVQHPAEDAGLVFEDEAVSNLVDDLRRTRVQHPDGSTEQQIGSYVEPVQLQVVCFRLWENLPPHRERITQTEIESVGSVDTALADYYAERVSLIAGETGVSQRSIRDWFEHQLITEQGLRGQVLRGRERSGGLDNQAIWLLADAHLIRAEQRAGATWFEMAHDRLIEPVQQDNAVWLETHLSLFQRQAALWDSQDRPDTLLLKDQALGQAQRWSSDHSAEMSPVDINYLDDSQAEMERQQAEERAREAKRLRRWVWWISGIGALAVVLAIIAAFSGLQAVQNRGRAEVARSTAEFAEQIARTDQARAEEAEETAQADKVRAEEAEETAQAGQTSAVAAEKTALAEKKRAEAAEAEAEAARAEAVAEEKLARSGELAALSLNVIEQQRDLAYLLSLQAFKAADTLQARNALLSGLQLAISRTASSIHTPSAQEVSLNDVALSADGKKLAFGGDFGLAKVWDVQNGVFTGMDRKPDPNEKRINAVALSPDGQRLFTGGEGGTIKVWSVQDGKEIIKYINTDGPIYTLAVSPDGKTLAYAGYGRNIYLRNANRLVESMGNLFTSDTNDDVLSIAWSPHSTCIFAGSRDGAVRVYEVNSEEENPPCVLFSMKEHEGRVNSVAWSPDGRWLASGGEDNRGDNDKTLILWYSESGKNIEPIHIVEHTEDVFSVAFSPDGKILAAGSRDGTLTLYDVDTRRKIQKLLEPSKPFKPISSVAFTFNPKGKPVLVFSLDKEIKLYEIATQQPLGNLIIDGKGWLKSLVFLSNLTLRMLGDQENVAKLWQAQLTNMDEMELFSSSGIPLAADISLDGQKMVFGYEDSTIAIWEAQSDGKFIELDSLDLGAGPIYSLALAASGNSLAAGLCRDKIELDDICVDNDIQIWKASSQTLLDTLEGSSGKVTSLAFSPNDPLLVSGTKDQTITFWVQDEGNKYEATEFREFSRGSGFSSLAFGSNPDPNSDERWLAAGNNIGEILMFDVNTLSQYGDRFIGASGPVTALAFSPDSQVLASGSQAGNVILWDLNTDIWEIRACELAERNLTKEEWDKYIKLPEYQRTCDQWPDG